MGHRSVGADKNTVAVAAEANSSFPGRAGIGTDPDSTSPWVPGGMKVPTDKRWSGKGRVAASD